MRYLNDFITRTQLSLEDCVRIVREKERELRACYDEDIKFNSDTFVKIMLVDTTFIIGVLVKEEFSDYRDETDRIFYRPWMISDVRLDMMLIENQLPFFILSDFYKIWTERVQSDEWPSIFVLSHELFRDKMLSQEEASDRLQLLNSSEVTHFVDFLQRVHLPSEDPPRRELQTINVPKIAELHSAGVKFKVGLHKNILDIQFNKGILQIPETKVTDSMEVMIRNLVAFEQYHCVKHYITDYVMIMDSLVDTERDVDLLIRYGILEDHGGNSTETASIINKLTDKIVFHPSSFLFADLCEKLNTYNRSSWHKWKANLRQIYFNTPWTVISFIAAVTLLVLTLIQTLCSVISTMSSNPSGQQH